MAHFVTSRWAYLEAIQRALEDAGVTFVDANGGGTWGKAETIRTIALPVALEGRPNRRQADDSCTLRCEASSSVT